MTPTGLICVHADCRVPACCDMLDDCIDMPFPGVPFVRTGRPGASRTSTTAEPTDAAQGGKEAWE